MKKFNENHIKGAERPLALYIHIPFCISRCIYCGFFSKGGLGEAEMQSFTDRLIEEICSWKNQVAKIHPKLQGVDMDNYVVDTIFFGGGTPSILPVPMMDKIVKAIFDNFNIDWENLEMTLESNPKTLNLENLRAYRKMGFNRLSIGLQSFDEEMLKFLSRAHSKEDFLLNYKQARAAGFENINVDIMFGLPNQSMEMWDSTLKQLCDLEPEHISFYSLQIEEDTPLERSLSRGEIQETSEETDRKMYHRAIEFFKSKGYEHYEISNCAKAGFHCKHNLKYWKFMPYLSFGPSGASFLEGVRWKNTDDLKWKVEEVTCNSLKDNMSDYAFTALRLREGLDFKDFENHFNMGLWQAFPDAKKNLKNFFDNGYLVETENRLYITDIGFDLSNQIMMEFV